MHFPKLNQDMLPATAQRSTPDICVGWNLDLTCACCSSFRPVVSDPPSINAKSHCTGIDQSVSWQSMVGCAHQDEFYGTSVFYLLAAVMIS